MNKITPTTEKGKQSNSLLKKSENKKEITIRKNKNYSMLKAHSFVSAARNSFLQLSSAFKKRRFSRSTYFEMSDEQRNRTAVITNIIKLGLLIAIPFLTAFIITVSDFSLEPTNSIL